MKMIGAGVVIVLAAASIVACGDDDAGESAATTPPQSDPAVITDPPAVTQSTADETDTTTASTTLANTEPWIAYTFYSSTGEPEGVALVHPDGSDDHEILTETPHPALGPNWSPDGTRLAVQIYSRESVWTSNADGSEPEVAARCTELCGALADPDWSPSGDQLLVTRFDDSPEPAEQDLYVSSTIELIDLRSGERRDILQSPYPELPRNPRWSPDGASYVVTVERFDDDGEKTGSAIAVGGLDGSPLRFLTDFEQWAAQADWHPHDDILAYVSHPPGLPASADQASNLYTMRADGTDVQAVTTFEPDGARAAVPRWTPDGEQILFELVDDPATADDSGQPSVMGSIRPDGTGLERVPLAGRYGSQYTLQPTSS